MLVPFVGGGVKLYLLKELDLFYMYCSIRKVFDRLFLVKNLADLLKHACLRRPWTCIRIREFFPLLFPIHSDILLRIFFWNTYYSVRKISGPFFYENMVDLIKIACMRRPWTFIRIREFSPLLFPIHPDFLFRILFWNTYYSVRKISDFFAKTWWI